MASSFLWLPGVSGSYGSAPDSAALSITNTITVRGKCAADVWTNASPSAQPQNAIMAKDDGSGNREWEFWWDTTKALTWSWWDSGGTNRTLKSNDVFTTADRAAVTFAVTFDVSTGTAKFWTSTNDGGSWTQLGTDRVFGATSMRDQAAQVSMGAAGNGTIRYWSGKFYRGQVYNNALNDGTGIVFDADFTTQTEGAATVTEDSANAATVTINGFARVTPLWASAPVTAATVASTTDATSYATASWTPKANRFYLLAATVSIGAGTVSTPTCSGNTNTWTEIRNNKFTLLGMSVFIMQSGSTPATAGATTIDLGGVTHTGCIIHIIEVDGADLTVANAIDVAVHHSNINTTDGASSPQSGSLGVAPAASSRCWSFWGTTATAVTPRANWTELTDSTYATPTTGQETQWRGDASEQTASITFTGTIKVRGVAVELRPATIPVPPVIVMPSLAAQQASRW